jgi:hypothetical protein
MNGRLDIERCHTRTRVHSAIGSITMSCRSSGLSVASARPPSSVPGESETVGMLQLFDVGAAPCSVTRLAARRRRYARLRSR